MGLTKRHGSRLMGVLNRPSLYETPHDRLILMAVLEMIPGRSRIWNRHRVGAVGDLVTQDLRLHLKNQTFRDSVHVAGKLRILHCLTGDS